MKAIVINIGDELLIGQIVNTNAAWLGNELTLQGLDVLEVVVIADREEAILSAVNIALAKADFIFMTGGLGPTKDDITKKVLAKYFDSEMYLAEDLMEKIKRYFDKREIPFLEAHKNQCYMPTKAKMLENKMGTAPGMLFNQEGKYLLSMPGVPYEMKWIMNNSFFPILKDLTQEQLHIYHRTVKTVGMGESRIADKIADIVDVLPPEIKMAYLPSLGQVKLRLTAKSTIDLSAQVDAMANQIAVRLGDLVFGYDTDLLGDALRDLLVSKGLTLSTAESCTGGYLAHRLTSVPGSSKYYMGSIIAYDYDPKMSLLSVSPETLQNSGAVSEETVKEMLVGLLAKFNTNLGVAISGIAGPGGGMPNKPVGTIWLAWGNKAVQKTYKLQLSKDREKNIQYTAVAAMNAIRKFAMDL